MALNPPNPQGTWLAIGGGRCPIEHDAAIRAHLNAVNLKGVRTTICPKCLAAWEFRPRKPGQPI